MHRRLRVSLSGVAGALLAALLGLARLGGGLTGGNLLVKAGR